VEAEAADPAVGPAHTLLALRHMYQDYIPEQQAVVAAAPNSLALELMYGSIAAVSASKSELVEPIASASMVRPIGNLEALFLGISSCYRFVHVEERIPAYGGGGGGAPAKLAVLPGRWYPGGC
jgi:hypothetical protein